MISAIGNGSLVMDMMVFGSVVGCNSTIVFVDFFNCGLSNKFDFEKDFLYVDSKNARFVTRSF